MVSALSNHELFNTYTYFFFVGAGSRTPCRRGRECPPGPAFYDTFLIRKDFPDRDERLWRRARSCALESSCLTVTVPRTPLLFILQLIWRPTRAIVNTISSSSSLDPTVYEARCTATISGTPTKSLRGGCDVGGHDKWRAVNCEGR